MKIIISKEYFFLFVSSIPGKDKTEVRESNKITNTENSNGNNNSKKKEKQSKCCII